MQVQHPATPRHTDAWFVPFGNLRTNITIANTGRVGGSSASGPYFAARTAHWGVQVTNDRSYAVCLGDIAPASVTLDIQGVADATSGLRPDYPGGVEALENLASLERTRVDDLYEQQRRARG